MFSHIRCRYQNGVLGVHFWRNFWKLFKNEDYFDLKSMKKVKFGALFQAQTPQNWKYFLTKFLVAYVHIEYSTYQSLGDDSLTLVLMWGGGPPFLRIIFTAKTYFHRLRSRGNQVRRHPCKLGKFYHAKKIPFSIVFTNKKRADRINVNYIFFPSFENEDLMYPHLYKKLNCKKSNKKRKDKKN